MNCHTCGRGISSPPGFIGVWHCLCCGTLHTQQPGRSVEATVPAVLPAARTFLEAFVLTVVGTEAATPEIFDLMKHLHAMCRNAPQPGPHWISEEDMPGPASKTQLPGWLGVGEVSSDELVRKMMEQHFGGSKPVVTKIWPPPANPEGFVEKLYADKRREAGLK